MSDPEGKLSKIYAITVLYRLADRYIKTTGAAALCGAKNTPAPNICTCFAVMIIMVNLQCLL